MGPVFAELLLLVACLVFTILMVAGRALLEHRRQLETRRQHGADTTWRHLAEHHRLLGSATRPRRLEGTVDGVDVVLFERSGARTVATARCPGPLPAGLAGHPRRDGVVDTLSRGDPVPDLDPALHEDHWVGAADPAGAQALGRRPGLHATLAPLRAAGAESHLEAGAVALVADTLLPAGLAEVLLRDAVATARGLVAAWQAAWAALAADHRLDLAVEPSDREPTHGTFVLTGTLSGCPATLRSRGGLQPSTTLAFTLPGFPAGVTVAAGPGGVDLRDPILGGRVCLDGPPETVTRVFSPAARDALRGDLLHLLQTHPGTHVAEGMLTLALPGQPLEALPRVLAEAGALAAGLREAAGTAG